MPTSQETILRPATPHDQPAIRRLVRVGGVNPLGIHWRRFRVITGEDGEVIACGQIKIHKDGSHELASIVVDPRHRGHGLARRVIQQLMEEDRGVLYLTCRASLEGLYRRFGFEPVPREEMPPYFLWASRLVNTLHRWKIAPEALSVMRATPRA